jgi:hypothetical protein
MVFRYADAARARQLVRHSGGRLRLVDERSLYANLPAADAHDPDAIVRFAFDCLRG